MPQSLSCILVHLVFSTKERRPFIKERIKPELHAYMATTLHNAGCPSLLINGTEDHAHVLFRLSRTIAIADVVEALKRDSSKWIKEKGREFEQFYWQAGYGAFSIGQSAVDAVKRYIADQKIHHRRRTFQDEFRTLLARYRVEYDERYVWD